jgi:hypothetical protein
VIIGRLEDARLWEYGYPQPKQGNAKFTGILTIFIIRQATRMSKSSKTSWLKGEG